MTMSTHWNEDEKVSESEDSLVPAVVENDGAGSLNNATGSSIVISEDFLSFVDALEKAGYDDRDRVMKAIEAGHHLGMRPLRALVRSGVPLEILENAALIKQVFETVYVR